MEKEITALIDSFITDFNQRRLEILDKALFSLLLKKEMYLLSRRKKDYRLRQIERILGGYAEYRDLIYNRLKSRRAIDKSCLVRRIYPSPGRLILLLTHNCQLRCKYCRVRKFPAVMSDEIIFKSILLLFTSNRQELQLQFFGGEPLLQFDLIKKAVNYTESLNRTYGRDISFILTTNGILLTKEKIDFFKKHKFIIECSIDGQVENQLKTRRAQNGTNYYTLVTNNFKSLFKSGIPHYSISVVMPESVSLMSDTFEHLVDLGFRRLQMNYALGIFWPEILIKKLFFQTKQICVKYLKKRRDIEFINMTAARKEPVVLNAELTVDCDGGIYLESGICLEEDFASIKRKFLVTDLKKAKDINIYGSTAFQNFYRLSKVYGCRNSRFRRIILNNIFLGQRYDSFIKHVKGGFEDNFLSA